MMCPYCGKDMNKGYIPTQEMPPQWIPSGMKRPSWKWQVSKDAVKCNCDSNLHGYSMEAYYCANCKIVLASTVSD